MRSRWVKKKPSDSSLETRQTSIPGLTTCRSFFSVMVFLLCDIQCIHCYKLVLRSDLNRIYNTLVNRYFYLYLLFIFFFSAHYIVYAIVLENLTFALIYILLFSTQCKIYLETDYKERKVNSVVCNFEKVSNYIRDTKLDLTPRYVRHTRCA